jgi:hypothetical protein
MNLTQASYFLGLAARKWDGRPRRQCAEDAWLVLFTLRSMEPLLPDGLREEFHELWEEYGGIIPIEATRPKLIRWLDSMTERQLAGLEARTIEFVGRYGSLEAAKLLD